MSGQEPLDRRVVAYHEAGHAVFALWNGAAIDKATIAPDGNCEGGVAYKWPPCQSGAMVSFVATMEIAVSWAGVVGESLYRGQDWFAEWYAGDWTQPEYLHLADDICNIYDCKERTKLSLEDVFDQLEEVRHFFALGPIAAGVAALANELLSRLTLSGGEAEAILRAVPGLEAISWGARELA